MSLKNLHNLDRIINSYDSQLGVAQANQFELLKGLLFYDWSESQKILMPKSFNHTIDLARKNGVTYSLFDYEKLVFDILQKHKHVWIKKATGLGITEFMLRYTAWLCLKDNTLRGSINNLIIDSAYHSNQKVEIVEGEMNQKIAEMSTEIEMLKDRLREAGLWDSCDWLILLRLDINKKLLP